MEKTGNMQISLSNSGSNDHLTMEGNNFRAVMKEISPVFLNLCLVVVNAAGKQNTGAGL